MHIEDRWNELRPGRIWSDASESTLPKSVAILEPYVLVLDGLWDEQSERFFDRRLATQESSTVIFHFLGLAVRGASIGASHVQGDVTPRSRPLIMEGALRQIEAHQDHGSDSARTPGGVRCDVVCGHVLDQLHLGSLATISMIS